jgi:hypothetical protein
MALRVVNCPNRPGYTVSGDGFNFFARLTGTQLIVCDNVKRFGYDKVVNLTIPIKGCRRVSADVLETLLTRALHEAWLIA